MKGLQMWRIYVWVFTILVVFNNAASGGVTMTCKACESKDGPFEVGIGGNLTITYEIKHLEVGTITVYYNKSSIVVSFAGKVSVKDLKDKRFKVPKEVVKKNDDIYVLEISIIGLTMDDDGQLLKYAYVDADATTIVKNKKIIVKANTDPSTGSSGADDGMIIGIVIVVVIILIIAILILLYKQGIIPTESCMRRGRFERASTTDKTDQFPLSKGADTEVKFVPQSQGHAPTEYAELGPGGRLGIPTQKPDKSVYAQVKTDDVHYPSPKYEAPASVIV